jgi:hypothetical protein
MNALVILLSLLGMACYSVCGIMLLGLVVYVLRWNATWTRDEMQSRLQAWTSENGYRVVSQRRPKELPLLRQISAGPFRLPAHSPWVYDIERRTPWKIVETFSTCLTVADSDRQTQSGRLVLVKTQAFPRPAVFETRWEGVDEEPPVLEPLPPTPENDPLWDPWTDSPGAG